MFKKIKEFFVGKPAEVAPTSVETAPYKVPEPAATTPIPLVVETAPAPIVEVAPVVEVAPEKKVRKPRAPKVETTAKEKAPAKAKAPKLTVIKVSKVKSKKV